MLARAAINGTKYTHIHRRMMKQKTHVHDFSAVVGGMKKNGLRPYFIRLLFSLLFSIVSTKRCLFFDKNRLTNIWSFSSDKIHDTDGYIFYTYVIEWSIYLHSCVLLFETGVASLYA